MSNATNANIYKSRTVLLELLRRQRFDVQDYENFTTNDIYAMAQYNKMDMIVRRTVKNEKDEDEVETAYIKYQNDPNKTLKAKELDIVVDELFFTETSLLEDASFLPQTHAVFSMSMEDDPAQEQPESEIDAGRSDRRESEGNARGGGVTPSDGREETHTVLRPGRDMLIYILFDEPNATLLKCVREYFDKQSIFILPFNIQRLLYNVLDHDLVPPHFVLSPTEVQREVVEPYRLNSSSYKELGEKLPEISRFDPVAMAIFMRPGQVCRIVRSSLTAITSNYYRVCV